MANPNGQPKKPAHLKKKMVSIYLPKWLTEDLRQRAAETGESQGRLIESAYKQIFFNMLPK